MLVLQGLDYWIWATANRAELARILGLPTSAPEVVIDFVVSEATSGGGPISPYSRNQAHSLSSTVGHRFLEISNWDGSSVPDIHPLMV
jgi:hypothetical protein